MVVQTRPRPLEENAQSCLSTQGSFTPLFHLIHDNQQEIDLLDSQTIQTNDYESSLIVK